MFVLLLLLLPSLSASQPTPSCGLVSPLLKVRAFDTPVSLLSPPALYTLSLARAEYESFQVICVGPLEGLDVAVALPAALAGTAPPPQLHSTLYYANAAGNLSDSQASQGLFPDPLVPFTDPFVGEARNRTTAVPGAQSRGFWVDFFAPAGAPAGVFSGGAVTVTAAGLPPLVLPFSVTVFNFTLPQTAPFATAFGFLAHALQTAALAAAAHPADEELQAAALLHDVGWLLPKPSERELLTSSSSSTSSSSAAAADALFIARHDVTGSAYLSSLGFSPRVCRLVGGHGMARRP
jgi:hypothetical protein